jgi:hypothetical protein
MTLNNSRLLTQRWNWYEIFIFVQREATVVLNQQFDVRSKGAEYLHYALNNYKYLFWTGGERIVV